MKTKNLDSKVEEFAALNYTIVMRYDDEGDVVASIKELDGCVAHGQDAVEALAALESMKRLWIKSCLVDNNPVPLPSGEENDLPSGKWLQRAPRTLHKKLADIARREGVSFNQYVVSVLAEAVGAQTAASNVVSIEAGAGFSTAGYRHQSTGPWSTAPESGSDFIFWSDVQGLFVPELAQREHTKVIQVKGGHSYGKQKEDKEFAYN
jgi:predicted RNase H-like HicB family nuclease